MKLVLDACVLFPPVLREILLGAAARRLFRPVWSERILEEWARASRRLGPASEARVRAEIATLRALWPGAMTPVHGALEARLHLPDEDDIHVLATAVASGADGIVTLNAGDFPRGTLAAEGLVRRDPDGLLWELWSHEPETVADAVEEVRATAERISGTACTRRALLRRAGLRRLAKAMEQTAGGVADGPHAPAAAGQVRGAGPGRA